MSGTLERVIAEQQAIIDGYKLREEKNMKAWEKQNERTEQLVASVFAFMNNPTPSNVHSLRDTLRGQGWCLTCEQMPCECDEYDC